MSAKKSPVVAEVSDELIVNLSNLAPNVGSRSRRKRLGIGEGSGNGKTCGKGQKGQRSRCGFGLPAGFEGGQMPIHRRLPKRGFRSRKKVAGKNVFTTISVQQLLELDVSGDITLDILRQAGLVRSSGRPVKILGGTLELGKKIIVEAHAISASARLAIEKAGGEVRVLV